MLALLEKRRERDPHVSLEVDFAVIHAGRGDIPQVARYLTEARDAHMAMIHLVPYLPPIGWVMHDERLQAVYAPLAHGWEPMALA